MKWSVYILLMAALIYVGETIRLPFRWAEQQARQQATKQCCHQGETQECPHRHNDRSSHNDNKNGCCNTTANCSNCPLCYTAELAAAYTSAGITAIITKSYPEIPERHLTEYTASTWKPPNA
jgi:hypothetical protein